jgi:orotidine-5'-phosphate decarboxylase
MGYPSAFHAAVAEAAKTALISKSARVVVRRLLQDPVQEDGHHRGTLVIMDKLIMATTKVVVRCERDCHHGLQVFWCFRLAAAGSRSIMNCMSEHFADRLIAACRDKGNSLCLGLDPRWEQLPLEIRRRHTACSPEVMAAACAEFCLRVVDLVAPLVAVVKPQSAFFEACGPAGLAALQTVLRRAHELGLIAILDSKRNDIASTAEAYADAAFAGTRHDDARHVVWPADAMTINPYLGRDAVEPFLASARKVGSGVFVLVRTSNKGAGQFQDLSCGGKPLYRHVAEAVAAWSAENPGQSGYGDVGAVVGATHPSELALIRSWVPQVLFLVPGYGAQGGSAGDVAAAFRDDGTGAVVSSSRGIIGAFAPAEPHWEHVIEQATRAAIDELARSTPMGALRREGR